MYNMDNNSISRILIIVLGIMIFILMILSVAFLILKLKENKKKKNKESNIIKVKNNKASNSTANKPSYNKQSIMNFMEFDKVEDNMIVQKNGRRYLMIVECQGVNYDLMSKIEKISVEEGFQQFLNTLRFPIQIYIQTRKINLEKSILKYKKKLDEIQKEYNRKMSEYNSMVQSEIYSREELEKFYYEVVKQRNLFEYSKDIINNTESMNLNKNVLNKKYYIVIPYFSEESLNEKYDSDELRGMAFSELYTKSQAIISTLSSCSINGKILSSRELVELLYEAYNRDESESFGIDKAIMAEYDSLYSTSQDVYEKKIKALDEQIRNDSIDLANITIEKVKSRKQKIAEEKEDNMDELISKMAQIILEENKKYVGEDVAKEAIDEIKEKGVEVDEKRKKTTRGRKKKSDK